MKNLIILLGMLLVLSGMMKMHEKTNDQYSKSFQNVDLDKLRGIRKDDKGRYLVPTGVMKRDQYERGY